MSFTESIVEQAAIEWLADLGYTVLEGPSIAPGEPAVERADYGTVVLIDRLRTALARLNPGVPPDALAEALRQVTHLPSPTLLANNHAFHRLLVAGVEVETPHAGRVVGHLVRLADFENPTANDWLAVNQFTVIENHHNRRPDIVLFLNGLPLVVIELKNAVDEAATLWTAFHQLQTYQAQIPSLFAYNAALLISDGLAARLGTLSSDKERFLPWRTIEGETLAPAHLSPLEVTLRGALAPARLLDLVRYFTVFAADGHTRHKKQAAYHQFHAVNRALAATLQAASAQGDRRGGVVWHTQGSGKSLTMAFYAGRAILHPALQNPTLVVLTDRNDLDDQLFATFAQCHELLRQTPVQAANREHLRDLLRVAAGGVVFTTVQKFLPAKGEKYPLLSDRRNIIVIADEAHRSQYDFIDGFARHLRDALPNASFIGFTGTPLELTDKNTRAVFGDYISIYDIQRAVADGATVPIYYESRLAQLALPESAKPRLDAEFEEVTEGEEQERKEALKTKWAALEAVVGAGPRLALIAQDIVAHFENRTAALRGKALIVGMSRRICVDLYNALIALRPAWHSADDKQGMLKVVMTGSAADPLAWQPHIRPKPGREAIAQRFKDPADALQLVIVRDMWLTGFDVPCLHTLYVDKPMRGHGLMQAIARVNRVFKDKPGGLVVDYLGLADHLKRALATYTASGGQGTTALDQQQAVALLQEKYEVCRDMFHGFTWSAWTHGSAAQRLTLLPAAQEFILAQPEGKARLLAAVTALSQAFALAVPHATALALRDDVSFFQAVRVALAKNADDSQPDSAALDYAIQQIVSHAIASDKVVDIFAAAGLQKPDLSILSDEFLAEVRGLPHRNLAVELLRKLLTREIQVRERKNLVQARSFAELLERAIRAYQNRALETAQIIEELIALAKDLRAAGHRAAQLQLSEEEIAFYDALETNDSAVQVLGDATLRAMARELVDIVRRNVTIDWTVKESVRAKLRITVKRILRKHGYPPDKEEKATLTVLAQAEVIAKDWAE